MSKSCCIALATATMPDIDEQLRVAAEDNARLPGARLLGADGAESGTDLHPLSATLCRVWRVGRGRVGASKRPRDSRPYLPY